MNADSKFEASVIDLVGLGLAAITLGVGIFAPSFLAVDHNVTLVLSIFLATVVLWIVKPVPYAVSSSLCVILLFTLGLTETFDEAVTGFASSLVFFLVLLLLIGKSVDKVGLDEWMANRLITSYSTPHGSLRRIGFGVLLLAFIMPSGMARAVTFMPIIDRINGLYGMDDDSQFRRLSYFAVGHLNMIGSIALMTGGGMAIATSGMISSLVEPITWIEWFFYMTPPIILLFGVSLLTAGFVYKVDSDLQIDDSGIQTDGSTDTVDGEREPLTTEQKLVVGTLLLSIFLWVVGSFTGIPTIVPAMIAVFVFSLPGVNIITTEDIHGVNWGIIFVVGAMLSLIEVMDSVNAFDLIIDVLSVGLPLGAPNAIILFLLFGAAVLVRATFSSIAGSYITLFPVLLEFATRIGANALYMSFGLAIILTATVFLPFNNPTVLIAYERGPLQPREVFLLGTLTLALAFGIVALSWTVYWPFMERVVPI